MKKIYMLEAYGKATLERLIPVAYSTKERAEEEMEHLLKCADPKENYNLRIKEIELWN